MIRWTPTRPASPPERWQSRQEILKAHLDSLSPDELRGVRPDYYWLRFGYEAWKRDQARKANFNPNQPRVLAGNPDGGQWTAEGSGINDHRVISDATPDNDWKPGAAYAQRRTRGPILINGRLMQPTPGQAARLTVAEAQARDSIRRLREVEPNWRPRPSAYETVEGLIRSHQADARQAEARLAELGRVGIGPGPHAGESIPARGPERDFTAAERRWGNSIGQCHTCGTREPGTLLGNFVLDHQWPNALNPTGMAQRLFPQCKTCSRLQAGWVRRLQSWRD